MATRYQFVDDSGETRLAGFLVPEPGGSTPAVGSSWLLTLPRTPTALAASSTTIAFASPPTHQEGSDISLSLDGLEFTFNADGWYSLYCNATLGMSADTVGEFSTFWNSANAGGNDIWGLADAPGNREYVSGWPDGSRLWRPVIAPIANFVSGDTCRFRVRSIGASGTAPDFLTTSFAYIVRIG